MTADLRFDIIDVRAGVEEENEKYAQEVRDFCNEHGIYLVNLMASPGAGKTTILCRLIDALREDPPAGFPGTVGVIEADVDADVDARTVAERGAKTVQLHTGGSCHMDAAMTLRGLKALCGENEGAGSSGSGDSIDGRDSNDSGTACPRIVFLENVGNLVCPAEFDVGADLKLMILSVPEGDDKPLKYPLMFTVSECLLVNKTDTAEVFDFDLDRCVRNVRALNEEMPVFPLSGRTGEGFEPFVSWLRDRIEGSPKGRIAGSPNREGGRIEGAPVDRTAGYPTAESRAER
ncbi:MAG: hydrogenase nickel incorporation protein HypB [Lachnospiraceae bacterium]|nr:hydrogenase nickel incorporation protein HypB [Lachnospiraceae bacterium]